MMLLVVLHELYSWKDVSPPKKKIAICTPKSRDQKQSFCRRDKQKGKTLAQFTCLTYGSVNFHDQLYGRLEIYGFQSSVKLVMEIYGFVSEAGEFGQALDNI